MAVEARQYYLYLAFAGESATQATSHEDGIIVGEGHGERSRLQLLLAAVAARTKPALTRGPEKQFARTRHEKINTHQKARPNR